MLLKYPALTIPKYADARLVSAPPTKQVGARKVASSTQWLGGAWHGERWSWAGPLVKAALVASCYGITHFTLLISFTTDLVGRHGRING